MNSQEILKNIINKDQDQQFLTGTISQVTPSITVILSGDVTSLPAISFNNLLNPTIGNRVVLLKYEKKLIILGIINTPASLQSSIKYKLKAENESVYNSSTLQNDNDFLFTFTDDMTGMYEIDMRLAVLAETNSDFKCAWAVTNGVIQQTTRCCLGPALAVSDNYDTTVKISRHNLTTSVGYGCHASNRVPIHEHFLLKVESAGTLQLQWAQYSAQTSNVEVSTSSYVIIKKLESL